MPRLTKLDRSVAGRVAVVTGAASGMGRATAWLLADEGAKVAALDANRPGVEETVAAIVEGGGQALAVACDLADPDVVEPVVEQVRAELGPVDILINNAGIAAGAPVDDAQYEDVWVAALEVNLTAQGVVEASCLVSKPHN